MKTHCWTVALVACLLPVSVGVGGDGPSPPADTKLNAGVARTWIDKKGRKVEGAFVSSTDGKVKIKRKGDGKVFEVPLDGLSAADQRFVKAQAGAGAAKTVRQVPAGEVRATEITNSIGMKLVLIPAGEFMMGSPDTDWSAHSDEKPAHRVQITKPFYMGVYEVTQGEYQQVMGKNPSLFSANGRGKEKVAGQDTTRYPVEEVSWEDAVAFCKKLSELSAEKAAGRSYRLPTEAEWEYAERGGTRTRFPWGDTLSSQQANFNGASVGGKRTALVGSYDPNPWGLYDTAGNVYEWCADWYAVDYYAKAPASDPAGPSEAAARVVRGGGGSGLVQEAEARGMSAFDLAVERYRSGNFGGGGSGGSSASYRVLRGGSWYAYDFDCRSAYRNSRDPDSRVMGSYGFRVAGVRSGG